jgi:cell division protease FtsH
MGTSLSSLRVNAEGGQVSDRTRQLRDEEQQHLADHAMRAALKIVRSHRDKLDALAFALLRNEVLERGEIDRIMADADVPEAPAGSDLRVVASEGH